LLLLLLLMMICGGEAVTVLVGAGDAALGATVCVTCPAGAAAVLLQVFEVVAVD
jgi:hypothetical protein